MGWLLKVSHEPQNPHAEREDYFTALPTNSSPHAPREGSSRRRYSTQPLVSNRLKPGVWWPCKAGGIADARFLIFQPCIRRGSVLNENFKRAPLPESPPAKPAAATAQ